MGTSVTKPFRLNFKTVLAPEYLEMARAILQGADLVVLDESFAELDPENLRHCLTEVAELSGTLVVVAHA